MIIIHLLSWFRRKPRVRVDIDVFTSDNKRAAAVIIGHSFLMGTPANGGPGRAA